jgi:hypothetical protein
MGRKVTVTAEQFQLEIIEGQTVELEAARQEAALEHEIAEQARSELARSHRRSDLQESGLRGLIGIFNDKLRKTRADGGVIRHSCLKFVLDSQQ